MRVLIEHGGARAAGRTRARSSLRRTRKTGLRRIASAARGAGVSRSSSRFDGARASMRAAPAQSRGQRCFRPPGRLTAGCIVTLSADAPPAIRRAVADLCSTRDGGGNLHAYRSELPFAFNPCPEPRIQAAPAPGQRAWHCRARGPSRGTFGSGALPSPR